MRENRDRHRCLQIAARILCGVLFRHWSFLGGPVCPALSMLMVRGVVFTYLLGIVSLRCTCIVSLRLHTHDGDFFWEFIMSMYGLHP